MSRLFPAPGLSLALLVLWLLLAQSLDVGTLLLGIALAIFWPKATARLRPAPARLRRPKAMARLLAIVVADMLRANVKVGWAILTRRTSQLQSGFVEIPLDLKDPTGLAVLSMIITFNPGTAWGLLSADRRVLLLHVLEIGDEAQVIAEVKHRYEDKLMEIFE